MRLRWQSRPDRPTGVAPRNGGGRSRGFSPRRATKVWSPNHTGDGARARRWPHSREANGAAIPRIERPPAEPALVARSPKTVETYWAVLRHPLVNNAGIFRQARLAIRWDSTAGKRVHRCEPDPASFPLVLKLARRANGERTARRLESFNISSDHGFFKNNNKKY